MEHCSVSPELLCQCIEAVSTLPKEILGEATVELAFIQHLVAQYDLDLSRSSVPDAILQRMNALRRAAFDQRLSDWCWYDGDDPDSGIGRWALTRPLIWAAAHATVNRRLGESEFDIAELVILSRAFEEELESL